MPCSTSPARARTPSPGPGRSSNQGQGHDEACRVEAWQALLNELGYDVDVDGLHDPGSTTATKKSQTEAKVLVTGTVDKTTWQPAGRRPR
ncbi:peptidoglycan-binding domain-containing protein [Nonomuraea angiospora]|uniref:peptidoglycan-binding domain-containing protein n=1 Tax=Nonomuraea angiospora TaxID=46172 RepID=UPI0033DB3A95